MTRIIRNLSHLDLNKWLLLSVFTFSALFLLHSAIEKKRENEIRQAVREWRLNNIAEGIQLINLGRINPDQG